MEIIRFKGNVYPKFQSEGNAAKFAIPFAKEVLKYCQTVFDVGCNRAEWAYPGSTMIDPEISECYWNALSFPQDQKPDAVFSSHMLEHVQNWVDVLNYWHSQLCTDGIVFLYLPDHSQKYWRPYFNRKHIHSFTPDIIKNYFTDQPEMWENVFCSGVDLNNSFVCVAQKK